MASEVGVFEAKNRLTALIDEVERGGEEVVITRRGKAVARLVPVEGGFNRARAQQAADELRAAAKGTTLGGVSIRSLIEEGRRLALSSTIRSRSHGASKTSRHQSSWRCSTVLPSKGRSHPSYGRLMR